MSVKVNVVHYETNPYAILIKEQLGMIPEAVNENLYCHVKRHFQQYFSYIVPVSFIGGGNRMLGENNRTTASH